MKGLFINRLVTDMGPQLHSEKHSPKKVASNRIRYTAPGELIMPNAL